MRRFLIKWQQRKETTFKMRKLVVRGKKAVSHIYMRAVFANWKREFLAVKRFCSRVDQAMAMLANTSKHVAFDTVRRFALHRHTTTIMRRSECRKRLVQILGHYN